MEYVYSGCHLQRNCTPKSNMFNNFSCSGIYLCFTLPHGNCVSNSIIIRNINSLKKTNRSMLRNVYSALYIASGVFRTFSIYRKYNYGGGRVERGVRFPIKQTIKTHCVKVHDGKHETKLGQRSLLRRRRLLRQAVVLGALWGWLCCWASRFCEYIHIFCVMFLA